MRAPIFFQPALGFPGKTYAKFTSLLGSKCQREIETLNVYNRGQDVEHLPSWDPLVEECIENVEKAAGRSSTGKVIGVGHSFGGSLHYIAAVRRPELYEKLVLLDSPMFGVTTRGLLYAAHWLDKTHVFIPHITMAKRKRHRFASREDVKRQYSGKGVFADMEAEVLADFITHGLKPVSENEGDGDALVISGGYNAVELVFPKNLEAAIFRQTPTDIFPAYKSGLYAPSKVPGYYLYSTKHDLVPRHDLWELASKFRQKKHRLQFLPMTGGHFFPLTKPEYTAQKVAELLH